MWTKEVGHHNINLFLAFQVFASQETNTCIFLRMNGDGIPEHAHTRELQHICPKCGSGVWPEGLQAENKHVRESVGTDSESRRTIAVHCPSAIQML